MEGLPPPPDRELGELLSEKIAWLSVLTFEAERRFDPDQIDEAHYDQVAQHHEGLRETFLKNYLTFDRDGNEHDWTEGRPWLENLPRSMAHGTYYGAVLTET